MMDYTDKKALGATLSKLIAMYDECEDATRVMRDKAARDVDYYDGKQWTDEEVRELKRRGQPVQTMNVIRDKIDYWSGLEKDQRTDPRALPRTPRHEEEANSSTDALRFVADKNDWHKLRSRAWLDFLRAGWMVVEVVAEKNREGEMDVVYRQVAWDRFFADPASSQPDYSDARYLGEVMWMDREDAIQTYGKEARAVYDETVSQFQNGATFDDKPANWRWVSRDRKRVRVIKMYHREADGWHWCEFTRGGVLKAGLSPWLDDEGQPDHPYEARSAYIDRDNNRYGAVRDMIDPQDAINKRLSKFLHLVSVRQTFAVDGVAPDVNALRKELARPDGHVNLQGGEFGKTFGVIPTGDMAQGQFELLQQALAAFETLGPNADMMGDASGSKSGRAILANQQGGSIQLGSLFDTLRGLDVGVFRKTWRLIRQYWTGPKWVRVTDDERNLKWVGINIPQMDPATGQIVVQNDVASLDVDIIVDEAPNTANIQSEQFGQLIELAGAGVIFPPKTYIKASSLRNKQELLRDLEEAQQAAMPAQGPDPMQIKIAEKEADLAFAQQSNSMELEHKRALAELDLQSKYRASEMEMTASKQRREAEAAPLPPPVGEDGMPIPDPMEMLAGAIAQQGASIQAGMAEIGAGLEAIARVTVAPKRVVRDASGAVVGVESVQ